MQAKAVCYHEHLAIGQMWPNILLIERALVLIGDQQHNNIRLLCGLAGQNRLPAMSDSPRAALACLGEANYHVIAAVAQVEGMGMPLAAIANDGDPLPL
ncbi:hypothetical protein KSC_088220 [Ktedonobacter sp. SOSP1-52]|nr:hypothetical protein KSC_088220 [Ktedonobacter sp. SOSP1-52]